MKSGVRRRLAMVAILGAVVCYGTKAEDLSRSARADTSIWRLQVKGNSATVDEHERITILEPAGKSFAYISAYESQFYKIASIEFSLYDAAGRLIKKYGKKDMTRYCGFGTGGVLYSDACTYYFEPVAASYPFTVVCDKRIVYNSLFFIPSFVIYRSIPTSFLHIDVEYESDNPVSYHAVNVELPANQWAKTSNPGYSWTLTDLPAIKPQAFVPAEIPQSRWISFTTTSFRLGDISVAEQTWKSFGDFYKQLADPRYLPPTNSVVAPASRDEAIITVARICEETAHNTRYVAVNIGLSGWQPELAEKTQKLGYGDCKAVTTLLVSRLKQAGLTAFPCLVKTADLGALDTTFVSHEFNHVIIMILVDSDTLYFDATCQTCPFGILPQADQDIIVLAVTDTGGVLVKTPRISADRNLVIRNSNISIDDSNKIVIDAEYLLSGQFAADWRNYLEGDDKDDRRTKIEEYFVRGRAQMKLGKFEVSRLDSLHVPLQITGTIQSPNRVKPINGVRYLLPFEAGTKTMFDDLDLKDRTIPIDLDLPRTIIDTVYIRAPWTATCDSVRWPANDSALFDGGSSVVVFDRDGDVIRAVLRQEYRNRIVPVESISQFGAYLKARRKLLDRPVKWYGAL